jgi:sugar fermentation stimulation protein A
MLFPRPLHRATLLRRYKRFLADLRLEDGREVVAHCANPGSMLGLAEPGWEAWAMAAEPGRTLAWSWQLVRVASGALVGLNTGRANGLVAEALAAGRMEPLAGYPAVRREVKTGGSRLDFLLEGAGRPPCYVEVKSVTLLRTPGLAEFPDSRTERGARHLDELAALAAGGARAVLLFLVQRSDAAAVAPAADIDPAYAAALARALRAGVEVLCYTCDVRCEGIAVAAPVPLVQVPV